jgi:hypothetical protein
MIFVEPSMLEDDLSVENLKGQDRGIVELIKSEECAEAIIQRHLENESWSRAPSLPCCNRCTPDLRPAREFQFIAVNPAPPTTEFAKIDSETRAVIYEMFLEWRKTHWREEWRARWPSYGPKSLISDADLEDVAKHAAKISSVEDLRQYTHIVHWSTLAPPLFNAVHEICKRFNLLPVQLEIQSDTVTVTEQENVTKRKNRTKPEKERLQIGETILNFS